MKRDCGTCTKCCEGWLKGSALGHTFDKGKPCHFVAIGKGCSVYAKRPKEPCISYKCAWLTNEDLPEWMKPSDVNAIIDFRIENNIEYIRVTEAGSKLDSSVLTWILNYALSKNYNITWEVDGLWTWIGSPDFNLFMSSLNNPINK